MTDTPPSASFTSAQAQEERRQKLAAWCSLYWHLEDEATRPAHVHLEGFPHACAPWELQDALSIIDQDGLVARTAATRELSCALHGDHAAGRAPLSTPPPGMSANDFGLRVAAVADQACLHKDHLHDLLRSPPSPRAAARPLSSDQRWSPRSAPTTDLESQRALSILSLGWTDNQATVSCEETDFPGDPGADVSFTLPVLRPYGEVVQMAAPDHWDDCSPFFVDTHWTTPPAPGGGEGKLYEQVELGLPLPGGGVWGKTFVTDLLVTAWEPTADTFRCGYKLDEQGTNWDHGIIRDHGCYRVRRTNWGAVVSLRKQLRFQNPMLTGMAKVTLKAGFMFEAMRALSFCDGVRKP